MKNKRAIIRDTLIIASAMTLYVISALAFVYVTGNAVTATIITAIITTIGVYIWRYLAMYHKDFINDIPTRQARNQKIEPAWIAIACGTTLSAWFAAQALSTFLGNLIGSPNYAKTMDAMGSVPVILGLIFIVIAAPVSEEALMRGLIYPVLRRHCSFIIAAFISAVMFGLLHGNILQFITGLLLGLVTAATYELTGKLRYPIMLHIFYNVMPFIIQGGIVTFLPSSASIDTQMYILIAITLVALIPTVCGIYALYTHTPAFRINLKKNLKEEEKKENEAQQ